jgi:TM2 domain/GYF domain 2
MQALAAFFVRHMGRDQGPFSCRDLQSMVPSGDVVITTVVEEGNSEWLPAGEVVEWFSRREWLVALLLSVFAGGPGIDRCHLGQVGLGILMFAAAGGCGIRCIVDIVLIAMHRLPGADGRPLAR